MLARARVDSLLRRTVACALALAVGSSVVACGQDNVLTLDVTADGPARRLRVEVKGVPTEPAYVEEFDVDPGNAGRDISDPAQAYRLGLRFPHAGRFGVHIVDVTNGVQAQSWAAWFDISGEEHGDAHLERFTTGDDDDNDGWPERCPPEIAADACVRDCNDGDANTNPFGVDVCEDGVDQDCTGADRPCEDADGDGTDERTDCDDDDPDVHPGQHETSTTCDGPDPRCDNGKDDDCVGGDAVCHVDMDCDDFWPTSEDGGLDCDDTDATVHPDAIDVCDDGIDQDCDGDPDDGCERCDEDGDGEYGSHPERGCAVDPSIADCDDSDRSVNHDATAACGGLEGAAPCTGRGFCGSPGVDEDCDGMVNEGCPTAGCDGDGDGYAPTGCGAPAGSEDCDDADPHVYPGAPDRCGDGLAQNCSIDFSCAVDADGDGYDTTTDCGDGSAGVHPWAVEVCNGVDDDCDGVIDEDNPGVTEAQPLAGAGCNFDNDGQCASGAGRCVCSPTVSDGVMDPGGDRVLCPGEVAGAWGARCFGAPQPGYERCDPFDWDCDERLDDPTGANLDPAELGQPCDLLPAPCVRGTVIGCDFAQPPRPYFTNPYWVCSADEVGPAPEICDGIDDDCDTLIDEGFVLGAPCDGGDIDLCNEGLTQCSATGGTECSDATGNNVETCNSFDDDCNGLTDEGYPGLGNPCDGADVDFCNEGNVVCNALGTGTQCSDATGSNVETCNYVDDDCDGSTDEGFVNLGTLCDGGDADLCNEGIIVCNALGTATTCSDLSGSNAELCNGTDDDCDGTNNEGFVLGAACDGADGDMCIEGTIVCNGPGTGTVCNDTTGTTNELCNAIDDDCDGVTNEGFVNLGMACDGAGDTDMCAEGTIVCNGMGTATVCTDMTTSTVETCNNVDDDCDLTTDEAPAATSCAPLGDTCGAGGVCQCGMAPSCNPLKADSCTAGSCRCGSGGACPGMQTCEMGSCT